MRYINDIIIFDNLNVIHESNQRSFRREGDQANLVS